MNPKLASLILSPWKILCRKWAAMLDLPDGEAEQQYQSALHSLTHE